jgi:Stage II sporulation protein E (SpoIIE)
VQVRTEPAYRRGEPRFVGSPAGKRGAERAPVDGTSGTMRRATRSSRRRFGAGRPAGASGSGRRAALERLLETARPHRPRRLAPRELQVEALSAAVLLVLAGGVAILVSSPRALSAATLALYTALYVGAARVRLYVGAGSVLPTQLILVPMLFALPLGIVPVVVAGGLAVSALIDVALGRAHPERVVTAVGDAWHAVAPAGVLALAGSPAPEPRRWPVFVVAFAAQCALDVIASTAREWAGRAIRPGVQLRVMASVYAVDGLLAPLGLLVAISAERYAVAPLLAAPLLVLLAAFAHDRRRRIDQAVVRYDELERERARLQETIRRVGEAFASNLDPRALLELVVETAIDALQAARGLACVGGDIVARANEEIDHDDDELAGALDAAEQAALADGSLAPTPYGGAWAIARPLRAGDGSDALGLLAVARDDRVFTDREQALLGYLASQAAVAIENARLYEERSELARTLATGLRPPALPSMAGWRAAALYQPAGPSDAVGGDFYDVISVGDAWMVIIGDVIGKGPPAAALTGLARYSIRTGATVTASPAGALAHLNDDLHREGQSGIISAACVLLRELDGHATATIACAGHPPPVRVHAGQPHAVGAPSLLLGVAPDTRFAEQTVTLDDDDTFVLYTDGVLDATGRKDRFGERRLLDALRGQTTSADETLKRVVTRLELFHHGPQRDDIAIVVIRRAREAATVPDLRPGAGIPLARQAPM